MHFSYRGFVLWRAMLLHPIVLHTPLTDYCLASLCRHHVPTLLQSVLELLLGRCSLTKGMNLIVRCQLDSGFGKLLGTYSLLPT